MEGEGFASLPHSAFCTFTKSLPYMCPYQSYKFSLALLPCQEAASSPIGCRSDARSWYRKQAGKKMIIIYINAWGWVTRYSQVTRDSECHIHRKVKFFSKACEILSDFLWKCSAKKENHRSFILLFLVFIKYLFFRTMSLHMFFKCHGYCKILGNMSATIVSPWKWPLWGNISQCLCSWKYF